MGCESPKINEKEEKAMMLLRVEKVEEGLHPSEKVVNVETRSGSEEVVVDSSVVRDAALRVGAPIETDGAYKLVELPRPTSRGIRRVWVSDGKLVLQKA